MAEKRDTLFAIHYCTSIGCVGDFELECLRHKMEYVKKIKSNGALMLKQQCPNCFESTGQLKISLVSNINSLPECVDSSPWQIISEERARYFQWKREQESAAFFEEHNKYLQSDKWKAKRLKVLERDGYLCQGCLENKATQVHHLSYKNWKDEPLFELISICKECHEKIHN